MFRKALDFFTHESIKQQEREAIIDLLNLICHVDGKIKLREQEYIDKFVDKLEWTSGTAKETYFALSLSKARSAVEGNQVDHLVHSIADRLTDLSYQEKALNIAEAIAVSDQSMSSKEAKVLSALKAKFKVD